MPYFAVDDRFHTHRKVMKLRRSEMFSQAIALWTLAGSWCCGQERERETGVIPQDVLASFGIPSWQQAMEELILAGLWEFCDDDRNVTDGDACVRFHEWDHWNVPGAAERRVENAAEKNRDRQRRYRERQRQTPRSEAPQVESNVTEDVTGNASLRDSNVRPGKGRVGVVKKPKVSSTTGSSFVADLKNDRADVDRICTHLADRIAANGSKRPTITEHWRTSARLMIDNDHHTEEQIHRAIDWCQSSDFWRSNVMSMRKLRDQYDALRLKALEESRRGSPGAPAGRVVDQAAETLRADREARQAAARGQSPALFGGDVISGEVLN